MRLTILIVDDDSTKVQSVSRGLREALPGIELDISTASDITSAKRSLQSTMFDAMVLDVALPLRPGDQPQRKGGIDLLKEVFQRDTYKRPQHIIGLTAYPDIYESAGEEFASELWSLLYYDPASDVWLERLAGKMRHIARVEATRSIRQQFDFDICIVTALGDELDQIRRVGWDWQMLDKGGDATNYWSTNYIDKSGTSRRVIAAHAPVMGMSAASILATKMGFHFRPRCLVMAGICAGDSKETNLGDLVVASPVWDYGSGKHVGGSKGGAFEPAPFQLPISSRLRGVAERLANDKARLMALKENFPGEKPDTALQLHMGPFASGAAVVADKGIFAAIKKQHRKLIAIDMEAYGVMSAAAELPTPQPECLVLKGVSDYGDQDKNDKFRHYAAYVSAQAIKVLCEEYGL